MILVMNSATLSQKTQQVSICHVLHDHYWVNCKETQCKSLNIYRYSMLNEEEEEEEEKEDEKST